MCGRSVVFWKVCPVCEEEGFVMRANQSEVSNRFGCFSRFAGVCLSAVFLGFALCDAAFASSSGGGLPWEAPLTSITNSIKGPVAFSVSLLMLVAGGAGLAFGGDVSGWLRYILVACLVIGVLGFATNLLTSLFGFSGAVVL